MGTTVTESDAAEIRAAAETGDEVAKALAANLPTPEAPKEPEGQNSDSVSASKDEPKAEKTKPAEKPKEEVEQGRESTGTNGREMHPATRRIVERETRRMREALEAQKREMDELKQIVQQSQTPKPKETTEEDPLTRLLAKPEEFLSEREKRLVERLEKQWSEKLSQVPLLFKKQTEREQAFKHIQGLEGFEKGNDDAWDELVDIIADRTGVEADFLYAMAEQQPLKFAALADRHWKEAQKLSGQAKADKKAASTGTAGGGKTGPTGPVTLKDLNDQFFKAKDKKEQDQILERIEALSNPK